MVVPCGRAVPVSYTHLAVYKRQALLTTTMPALGDAVAAIKGSDVEKSFKIMVGGAPVTQAFADEIGADAFAEDAGSAAKVAKEIA